MKQEEKIYHLFKVLEHLGTDVKAEVLINQAIENGFPEPAFVTSNNGFFFREFARDIYASSVIEDNWYRNFLELQLSRPGFYDMLPEALFHQPETTEFRQKAGVAEMTERYKKNTIREKEVRKFFQPIENEFFQQQVMLEKEEVHLLDILKNTILSRFFLSFWGLPHELKTHEAASFLLLLPYAHQINGNISLMESCLKALLHEEVKIYRREPGYTEAVIENAQMGEQQLGDDMVCGTNFMEDYPVLSYNIGPLKKSKVVDYIQGGTKALVIETFNNYFLPVETDVDIDIAIDNRNKGMSFEEGSEAILGYASILKP